MALDSAKLGKDIADAIDVLFADNTNPPSAADVWAKVSELIVAHIVDNGVVKTIIPSETVVIAVAGGSGAPAVGTVNPLPIELVGEKTGIPPGGID